MGFKNVFQGLTRLFSDGSPSVALNQQTAPQPNTYNLNGNDILFKTNNKDEYEAKSYKIISVFSHFCISNKSCRSAIIVPISRKISNFYAIVNGPLFTETIGPLGTSANYFCDEQIQILHCLLNHIIVIKISTTGNNYLHFL